MPQPPFLEDQSSYPFALPQAPARRSRAGARKDALIQAPGRAVLMLRPAQVKVRDATGTAIAYTVTHILVESEGPGPYTVRWEPSWLVRRL